MRALRNRILLIAATAFVGLNDMTEAFHLKTNHVPPVKSSRNTLSSFKPSRVISASNESTYVRPSSAQPMVSSLTADGMVGRDNSDKQQSFRTKVKDIVIGGIKNRISSRATVEVIEDITDFKDYVSSESKEFVAVMFHAPFCKACQATKPHFQRLAKKYSQVKFVSVPLTDDNKSMLKSLGVEKFPFAHIYDPEKGLVDELPILRKLVPRFEETLRLRVMDSE